MNLSKLPYKGYEQTRQTGYEQTTPSQTLAALAFLARTRDINTLVNWIEIPTEGNHRTPDRYTRGALALLETQWVLDRDEQGRFKLNQEFLDRRGREQIGIALDRVRYYGRILATVEQDFGWKKETNQHQPLTEAQIVDLQTETTVTAALSAFKVLGITEKLLNGERLKLEPGYEKYAIILRNAGVIDYDETTKKVSVRPEGRKAKHLSGYAILNLSYYLTYTHLVDLFEGNETYGLGESVNRQQTANAIASNGIIKIKVAPAIAGLIENSEQLKKYRGEDKLVAIDYGSGGGDMSRMILEKAPKAVEKTIGIDLSPTATKKATEISEEEGYADRSEFVVGDITSPQDFAALKNRIEGQKAVHSINFILHESPELANAFLANFAAVFGDQPLVITETLRVPQKALRAHPNTQAPSFYFMHDISGQVLYSLEDLQKMLAAHGFKIVETMTHSSLRDENNVSRAHDYIVSFVVRRTA